MSIWFQIVSGVGEEINFNIISLCCRFEIYLFKFSSSSSSSDGFVRWVIVREALFRSSSCALTIVLVSFCIPFYQRQCHSMYSRKLSLWVWCIEWKMPLKVLATCIGASKHSVCMHLNACNHCAGYGMHIILNVLCVCAHESASNK